MALGRAALEDALPRSAHKPLGLPLIGDAVGRDWTDAEAHQFEEGMLEHGRDFPAIRKEFLPQRETEHLVLYYYNVWKTQSTARAQAWYRRLEEVSPVSISTYYIPLATVPFKDRLPCELTAIPSLVLITVVRASDDCHTCQPAFVL